MRLFWLPLLLFPLMTPVQLVSAEKADVERTSVADARTSVQNGSALLVCSYADDGCKDILLEGAILLSELETRLPSLQEKQRIIFYCA